MCAVNDMRAVQRCGQKKLHLQTGIINYFVRSLHKLFRILYNFIAKFVVIEIQRIKVCTLFVTGPRHCLNIIFTCVRYIFLHFWLFGGIDDCVYTPGTNLQGCYRGRFKFYVKELKGNSKEIILFYTFLRLKKMYEGRKLKLGWKESIFSPIFERTKYFLTYFWMEKVLSHIVFSVKNLWGVKVGRI